MHLTNYAINKLHPDFIFNESATRKFLFIKKLISDTKDR
jgi:hypothetical protein